MTTDSPELRNRAEVEADVAARQRMLPDWTLFERSNHVADGDGFMEVAAWVVRAFRDVLADS